MNLMSLFNIKYLMQNIKKSKGLIILLLLLVPMFTSILLLSVGGDYALTFAEVSIINIIGMYIIPIALSMTLFSYVYKKNSVDFVGSMPLSRKTIFLTNTLGGISIIAIMQLLTLICTVFLSKVLSDVIIFGAMAWDIFIFFTISYIFVFTVSNLAMSFSGNKISQLVVTCLILFLIPFLILSADAFGDYYTYINIGESLSYMIDETSPRITIDRHHYFTAPSYLFDMITTDFTYEYSSKSIIKMFILSIIYAMIGLLLFNRKKLEMAGESYENKYLHLFIKMLTFIPFMFVFCSLGSSDRASVFLFFVAILAVYYFIFDLVTNKKVKLKLSILSFIISGIVIFAIYEGIVPKFGRNNIEIVKIEDVDTVTIEAINRTYRQNNNFNLTIDDKALIKLILQSNDNDVYTADYYSSKEEIYNDKIGVVVVGENIGNEFYQGSTVGLNIKMNNGKEYKYTKYINANIFKQIIENYGDEISSFNFENSIPIAEGIHLSNEEKKEIIKIIEEELKDVSYKDLYRLYTSDTTEYTLTLYDYENNKLIRNNVSFIGFKKLYQYMAELYNKRTLNLLNELRNFSLYRWNDVEEIVKVKRPELFSGDNLIDGKYEKLLDEFRYNVFDYAQDGVLEFIKEDSKNEININEEYIVIRTYYPTYYYTNNIEKFNELIIKSYDNFIESQAEYYLEY